MFLLPRPSIPKVPHGRLAIPSQSALVAVDLIRTSFDRCRTLPWSSRLAWLHELGKPGTSYDAPVTSVTDQNVVMQSAISLFFAKELFEKYFQDLGPIPETVEKQLPPA